jgi:hypothetical protein
MMMKGEEHRHQIKIDCLTNWSLQIVIDMMMMGTKYRHLINIDCLNN